MPKLAIIGYGKMGRLIDQLAPEYGFTVTARVDVDRERIARRRRRRSGIFGAIGCGRQHREGSRACASRS